MNGLSVDEFKGQLQNWLGSIWCFFFRVDTPGIPSAVPASGFQETLSQQEEPPTLPQPPATLPRTEHETAKGRNAVLVVKDEVTVRAPAYLIASSHCRCWKCSGGTVLYVLAVEPPFERRDGPEQWRSGTKLAILSYVKDLQEQVIAHLRQIAPRYFCDESQWHSKPYWMNHCEHCGAKIGDYETIESISAPFSLRILGRTDVKLLYVPESLEAVALLVKT